MDRFLVLVLGSISAVLLLKYRGKVKDFVGEIGFAERIFGMGGTNTFIVIFALLVFIFSLMYAFGTLQGVLQNTVGRLF